MLTTRFDFDVISGPVPPRPAPPKPAPKPQTEATPRPDSGK